MANEFDCKHVRTRNDYDIMSTNTVGQHNISMFNRLLSTSRHRHNGSCNCKHGREGQNYIIVETKSARATAIRISLTQNPNFLENQK